jgi:hypothetical protein
MQSDRVQQTPDSSADTRVPDLAVDSSDENVRGGETAQVYKALNTYSQQLDGQSKLGNTQIQQ